MAFDIETDEDCDDLEWPVTPAQCIILVTGYLLALIGIGASAAWALAQLTRLILKQ